METKLNFGLGFPAVVFTPVPDVLSLLTRLTAAQGEAGGLSLPSRILPSAGSVRTTKRRRQGEKQGEQEKGEGKEEEKWVLAGLSSDGGGSFVVSKGQPEHFIHITEPSRWRPF